MSGINSAVKSSKSRVRRALNWKSVAANQSQILQLAKLKDRIYLKPTPPVRCGGTVDRYYHFIFDLALPLYCLLERVDPKVTFLVEEVGNFTEQLLKLFPKGVEVKSVVNTKTSTHDIALIGMNPKCVFLSRKTLDSFKRSVCERLGIALHQNPNKVLLIERLPPDEYFFTKAKVRGGGASWRSIINHADLRTALESAVKEPFEFYNLQLEKQSLEEQIRYFSQAVVVVAQHGAGLSNCIWMKPKTHVIELGYDERDNHFQTISQIRQLNYLRYQTNSHHATIDIESFMHYSLDRHELKQYFNSSHLV